MFGFIIGTLSLIGLVKVIRHGRGWGYGGWHGGGGGYGGRGRWMLRRLFQRLDTTPGQEKVITEAFEELQEKGRAIREQFMNTRSTFAKAVRGEAFDTEAVNVAFETQSAKVEELRKAVLASLQKIHEALTPEQRSVAGDLLEYGPRYAMGGGCGGRARWGGHGHGRYGHHGHGAVNL
jgi:Spy/CpxP family protein refolding chaperone